MKRYAAGIWEASSYAICVVWFKAVSNGAGTGISCRMAESHPQLFPPVLLQPYSSQGILSIASQHSLEVTG